MAPSLHPPGLQEDGTGGGKGPISIGPLSTLHSTIFREAPRIALPHTGTPQPCAEGYWCGATLCRGSWGEGVCVCVCVCVVCVCFSVSVSVCMWRLVGLFPDTFTADLHLWWQTPMDPYVCMCVGGVMRVTGVCVLCGCAARTLAHLAST